jgi:chromosome segregation ATPase
MNDQAPKPAQPSAKGSLQIPILFGLVIALAAANIALFVWLDNVKRDVAQMRDTLLTEVAKVRETHTLSSASSRQHLDELRADLETSRRQAAMAAGDARKDALKHADQLARQLQEEQIKQQAQVRTELTEAKEAASTANTKIADVSTDVGNVKTEVASTKAELSKTIAELKSVRGDLGVQSGLIATNGKELAALRTLGERNYYEFKIARSKQYQKVGNVQVLLKKADPKRNQYTIEVIADDKKVEKKDKNTNEPLQFYMSAARQPYEIVVNEVRKDQIAGYLSSPKVTQARN